jgi:hypothetical protein
MEDITYSLAEAATGFHAADTEVENLAGRLAAAQAERGRWLPIYFRSITDALADGRSERDIAREVREACGRSDTSVRRDIVRAMVATATGWTPDATIGETPNLAANGGPTGATVKAAIAEVSGKREARDVVRALFAPEPAPEHATETETETEDTGSGNVTGSARGPVLPYDALVRALTAYAETEDMDAHVFAHNVNNAMMDIIAAKWATAPANA